MQSSSLAAVGYDPGSRTLEIEFVGGGLYRYFDVPAALHRDLMEAESHGRYFDRHVKKAGIRYLRIR